MERHALLHRIQHRRQLSRRMTARPSLLTYVTGHNPLPNTLNPQNSAPTKFPAPLPSIPKLVKQAQPELLAQFEQQYNTTEATTRNISFENESSATLQDDAEHRAAPNPDQAIEQSGGKNPSHTTETHHAANTTQKQQQIGNEQARPATHTPRPAANREHNERAIARTVTAHDAPPANRRFAAHDAATDEDGTDMVGAGAVDDGGRGPLRSPVVPSTRDEAGDEPLRSPVLPTPNDGKHEPSRLPIVARHENERREPSPVLPTTDDAKTESTLVVAQHKDDAETESSRSPVVAQNDNRGVSQRLSSPAVPRTTNETEHKSSPSPIVSQTHDGAGYEPSPVESQNHDVEHKDGRPQGSTLHTTPPPPLPYDAPPANLRFAAHDTATDEDGTDMVGAGAAEDVGRGPLRSPVVSPTEDVGRGPLRSPVVSPTEDGVGDEPSRSPVVPDNHENQKPAEIHQARPRRGRIEERPASTMSTTPPVQGPQPNTPAPKKPELASRAKGTDQPNQSGKTGKPEQPKSQAQIEADALFQSNGENANRTPQQWLAMLMKAERGKQPDEPAMPDTPSEPARRDDASPSSDVEDAERETHKTARSSQHNHAIAHPTQKDENAPAKPLPVVRPLSRTATQPEHAQAEPLSQQTRQFLRPLVGYDPANARVHRGVPAARFAASHNAQAVTSGDDIALGAGHQSDTPETLGLLAHELTHVARQHTPGFVPPVANNGPVGAQFIAPSSPSSPITNSPTNEEGVAEQVEQQAVQQARGQAKQAGKSSQWGGLPAPWEPLPDWLTSSPATGETHGSGSDIDGNRAVQPTTMDSRSLNTGNVSSGNNHAAHTTTFAAGTGAAASNGNSGNSANSANSANGGNGGGVQRAGNERSMNIMAQEVNEPSRGQQQNDTMQEPEPDLDELARQVYTVLKRRLGVERRRMG